MSRMHADTLLLADLSALQARLHAGSAHPFAAPDVVRWCYESAPRLALPVRLTSTDGEWVFPLRLDTAESPKVARLYGHGLLDVMDCLTIGAKGAGSGDVIRELLRYLKHQLGVPVLDLVGVEEHSSLHELVREYARSGGGALLSAQTCRRASTRNSPGAAPPRFGRTLRKRLRQAAEEGFHLEVCDRGPARAGSVRMLLDLHRRKWDGEMDRAEFDELRAFVAFWASRPDAVFPTLVGPNASAASILMIIKGPRWHHFYIQAYDPAFARFSPSRCAIALYLQRLRESHPSCGGLDFMRGDEAYKREFCDASYPLIRFTAWADERDAADASRVHCSFV